MGTVKGGFLGKTVGSGEGWVGGRGGVEELDYWGKPGPRALASGRLGLPRALGHGRLGRWCNGVSGAGHQGPAATGQWALWALGFRRLGRACAPGTQPQQLGFPRIHKPSPAAKAGSTPMAQRPPMSHRPKSPVSSAPKHTPVPPPGLGGNVVGTLTMESCCRGGRSRQLPWQRQWSIILEAKNRGQHSRQQHWQRQMQHLI